MEEMNSSQDAAVERLADKLETNAPRRSERKRLFAIAGSTVRSDADVGVGERGGGGSRFPDEERR